MNRIRPGVPCLPYEDAVTVAGVGIVGGAMRWRRLEAAAA